MNPLALKSFIAAVALVASGGFAAGTVAFLSEESPSENHAQTVFGGRVIESWSGAVEDGVASGTLDLRAVRGNVHVATWDRAAYEVTLLTPDASDNAQRVSDGEFETAFDATDANGTLGLSLKVSQSGTVEFSYGARNAIAIVAFVPEGLAWEDVVVCTGSSGSWFTEVWDAVDAAIWGDEDEEDAACLEEASHPLVSGSMGGVHVTNETRQRAWHVPFAVNGLSGTRLSLTAPYADLALVNASFDEALVATEYGDVTMTNVAGDTLRALTAYGDIIADEAMIGAFEAVTKHGDIVASVDFAGESEATLKSAYGDLILRVPAVDKRAYRVDARTHYGDIRIALPGVSNAKDTEDEEDHTTTLVGVPHLAPGEAPSPDGRERYDEAFQGETEGFESFPDRLTLNLVTRHGDVTAATAGAGNASADDDDAA